MNAETDQRLVSLARTGHDPAFTAIVERYHDELQAHARRLSSDGRAEDIVQQALLNALIALRSGAEVRHLRGWLHQIVRNEAVRARAPIDAPLEEAAAGGEPLEVVVQQRAHALAALSGLSRLPRRQREALVGTALLGRARADIAETMGLSEGAVRQLVHRARVTLRTAITALTPYPLTRLWTGARSGATVAPDVPISVGTASAGAAAVKIGALLASGALATGLATIHVADTERHAAPGATVVATAAHRSVAGEPRVVAVNVTPAVTSQSARTADQGPSLSGAGGGPGGPGRRLDQRHAQGLSSTGATQRHGGRSGQDPSSAQSSPRLPSPATGVSEPGRRGGDPQATTGDGNSGNGGSTQAGTPPGPPESSSNGDSTQTGTSSGTSGTAGPADGASSSGDGFGSGAGHGGGGSGDGGSGSGSGDSSTATPASTPVSASGPLPASSDTPAATSNQGTTLDGAEGGDGSGSGGTGSGGDGTSTGGTVLGSDGGSGH
jgi:RNA polymerase sigma factor (sigma-70 family)